MTTQYFFKTL